MSEIELRLTVAEAKSLLVFLRKSEIPLPKELSRFEKALCDYVFPFITVDEAERIF